MVEANLCDSFTWFLTVPYIEPAVNVWLGEDFNTETLAGAAVIAIRLPILSGSHCAETARA